MRFTKKSFTVSAVEQIQKVTKINGYSGSWTLLPPGFKETKDLSAAIDQPSRGVTGIYHSMNDPDSDLIPGICSRYYSDDPHEKTLAVRIDIELPGSKEGSFAVLAELLVPLKYVDLKILTDPVKRISVKGNTIRFDLGKGVFEFKYTFDKTQ